jgi:RNA 2',3'-cyclic 3'-phosphodiesterase
MRLFAALPVPDAAREEIERRIRGIKREPWPVRWVKSNGLHLTLKFFGEVEEDRLDAIAAALKTATAGVPALDLGFGEVSAFPEPRRARVIVLGLEGPAALELLANQVERECEPLGFEIEARPFRPHVTLGRVRQGERLRPEAVDRLAGLEIRGGFLAPELVLYESRLGPEGPSYIARAAHRLKG